MEADCVREQGLYENSVLSAQFCLECKTALQNKIYLNKQILLMLSFSLFAKRVDLEKI